MPYLSSEDTVKELRRTLSNPNVQSDQLPYRNTILKVIRVTFEGPSITLSALRKQIMGRWRLKACRWQLRVTDAQSGEEYIDNEALIPTLSSVIVRRFPNVDGSDTAGEASSRPVQDKNVERPKRVRTCKGIPRSFMVTVEADTKGAMLTNTGEYVIPVIDAQAYAQGKKEHPPFVPRDQSSSEEESDPIPAELLCPICNDLMTDAAIIPCCGNSYCDECIRDVLLDSEEHICFTCKQLDVSPDSLTTNNSLRQAVSHFKNGTRNTKCVRKPVQYAAPPPPRPQWVRPLGSRQQDPLLANVPHTSSTSVPPSTPKALVQPPAPPAAPTPPPAAAVEGQDASLDPPPVVDHHSPMKSISHVEPPPSGETDPEPSVRPDSSVNSQSGLQNRQFSVVGHPSPTRPPHSSVGQSQHHRYRGGGGGGGGGEGHWERSSRSSHLQVAPPPTPVPLMFPPPFLFPPPLHLYPPPFTTGPIPFPPPAISYQPQPVYAPAPPLLNPPWVAPGTQPPLVPLPSTLPQPPLSKEDFYRQRHHRQDKVTSKLEDFTEDHKELRKDRNALKRQRMSHSSRSSFRRSFSRSRSRSKPRTSRSRSRSNFNGRSYPRSPYSRSNGPSCTRSPSPSRSYGHPRSGSQRSPPSYRGGAWEGAGGAGPYRSRSPSRSPSVYRSRSPVQKPPPLEPGQYKPLKTIKTRTGDAPNSNTPKKEKGKSCGMSPPLLKTPPLSQNLASHHPSVHDGPRPRERDRGTTSDRERDRVSGTHKAEVTVERNAARERSVRTERKASIPVGNMTVGEKSAVSRRMADHQEKPSTSSKERGEASERASKFDRSVSKDRRKRRAPSREKSTAAPREAVKEGEEPVLKSRPRISHKVSRLE